MTTADPVQPSLYLVERYVPTPADASAYAEATRASEATASLASQGTPVRYLGSLLVPADETCFSLFEAHSADQVRHAHEHASIQVDRIVEAVRIEPEPQRHDQRDEQRPRRRQQSGGRKEAR